MKLLLSSLLIASLCAITSWSVSSTLVVTHSPDVSVMEGETVTITCCGTLEFDRITLNWLKNQIDIETEIFIMKNHSKGDSLQQEASHCSNLTFTKVTREDSGRYTCRVTVEVPLLKTVEGNGTVITVIARDKTTDNTAEGVSSTPVTQSPDVSVIEGETVTITCCWTMDRVSERGRFDWLKNQTKMKTETFIVKDHSKGDSLQNEASHCSNLNFTNVTIEDSGRYTCRVTVEIPLLKIVEGNGTIITVTARDNTTDKTTDNTAEDSHLKGVLIFVLRCLPIVALVVTFFSINYLAKKAQQRAQAPGRTEENQKEEEEDETEI